MQIVQKSVEDLIPYINNPRLNDDAVNAVASSIAEFGFKVPIVVDKNNVIVTGHTRLKAAKKLGLETVPVVVADDLSDAQIKAFRLADNKVSEAAGWDYKMLDIELEELMDSSIDMSQFGFESLVDFDIDGLFTSEEKTQKEKEPKTVQCPYCGEWFEL